MKLDKEITDTFALLGLLLVFVLGYFAAVFPLVQGVLGEDLGEAAAEKRRLASRARTYRVLVGGILLLTVSTGCVVAPLTWRVLGAISVGRPFSTVRAGLLLVDVMLLALLAVTLWLWVGLGRKRRDVLADLEQAAAQR